MDEEIIGVVIPTLQTHAERILSHGKDVLAKYVSRIPERPQNFRLKKGMKVLFYVSGSGRRIAGEGQIADIAFMTPIGAIEKYKNRLVLSRKELLDYMSSQPNRNLSTSLMVLEMKHLRKFASGVIFPKNISMAGEYLTPESYNGILEQLNALRH